MSFINTDAWLSGTAVGVSVDFGFSPDVEDFDLRAQSSEVASTSATTGFKLVFKKQATSTAFQIFNAHLTQTLEE